MGLVNRVAAAAELEARVREDALRIARNAPLTVKAAKLAVDAAVADAATRDLDRVHRAVEACHGSDDYKEGRRAFLEKRAPRFKGS